MKSRAERLDGILANFASALNSDFERAKTKAVRMDKSYNMAREAIVELLKECAPNEFSHNDKNDEASCNCAWIEGYNDCRFETLKNMEELR